MLAPLESYCVGALVTFLSGVVCLIVYIFETLIEKFFSLSALSFYFCLSNAVYYYSLPLLRSDLVSVHLQLDRQHRSIQVGHVL